MVIPVLPHFFARSSQWEVCSGIPDKFDVTESDMINIEDNEINTDSDFLQSKVNYLVTGVASMGLEYRCLS